MANIFKAIFRAIKQLITTERENDRVLKRWAAFFRLTPPRCYLKTDGRGNFKAEYARYEPMKLSDFSSDLAKRISERDEFAIKKRLEEISEEVKRDGVTVKYSGFERIKPKGGGKMAKKNMKDWMNPTVTTKPAVVCSNCTNYRPGSYYQERGCWVKNIDGKTYNTITGDENLTVKAPAIRNKKGNCKYFEPKQEPIVTTKLSKEKPPKAGETIVEIRGLSFEQALKSDPPKTLLKFEGVNINSALVVGGIIAGIASLIAWKWLELFMSIFR